MPHSDETFYKMKCGWAEDPKVATLARFGSVDACLARDLFGQMIDYARRELTDGLVPGEVIGQLGYPLPAEDAMRIVMLLADPGPYGPLCRWYANRNAFSILAYRKWNDTKAEVEDRKAKGVKAARARWDATGNADGIHRARAQVHTEQEQEQDLDRTNTSAGPPRGEVRDRRVIRDGY